MNIRNLFIIVLLADICSGSGNNILMPVIDGQWRQIAGNPDLGQFTDSNQQPVDFAIWQAADGSWQLWSCIRGTKCDGHTRLFFRWEARHITDADWTPMGIAMMAEPEYGEPAGSLQAPHVVKHKNKYWLVYGDWNDICLAVSTDGKTFKRVLKKNNSAALFNEGGPEVNTRDPMLLRAKNKWFCYYTACPDKKGYVFCRTSSDLKKWSDSKIVAFGGSADAGWASAECPHVVELEKHDYYLFRTQFYGPGAQTSVYYSTDPLNFGINDDSHFVCKFNIAAPEIIKDGDQYYIAALNPNLDGIRIAKLKWALNK
ncbi:MAG: hypothetical protein ABSE89_01615 [Sedimentisphaerales bacterium]